ncbi:MAG: hypothetical protein PF637_01895 [Spirochaetes bacterium]|jgi:hypothetical protein|nr:hypothetical protein [Spirochaetota bacterium]
MDIGSISQSMQSTIQLGDMLKDITSQQTGLTDKLVGMAVEQKVGSDKVGNLADFMA